MPKILGLALWLGTIGWAYAAQSEAPDSVPIWSREIVPDLSRTRNGGRPLLLDSNRAGVVFLKDQVIVYAVDHDLGQLSSRESPEMSSPFRLHVWLVDANSGKLVLAKDWGTRVHDSAIQVTTGGVLIKTGGIVRLYSADFAQVRNLLLPPDNLASPLDEYRGLITRVSPTGKTILVERRNEKRNLSRLDVFDGNTLEARQSWTQPWLSSYGNSISDASIATAYSGLHKILVADFGGKSWNEVADTTGFCAGMNKPTFVADDRLVYGCDKFIEVSTDGRVLMTDSFPKGDTQSGKTSAAQGGEFVAVSLDSKESKKHLLTEVSVRLTAMCVVVYDLKMKKRVLTVGVDPLPKNDFDFVLSPDGSKLAVLNDRKVSVYSVPVQPAATSGAGIPLALSFDSSRGVSGQSGISLTVLACLGAQLHELIS